MLPGGSHPGSKAAPAPVQRAAHMARPPRHAPRPPRARSHNLRQSGNAGRGGALLLGWVPRTARVRSC